MALCNLSIAILKTALLYCLRLNAFFMRTFRILAFIFAVAVHASEPETLPEDLRPDWLSDERQLHERNSHELSVLLQGRQPESSGLVMDPYEGLNTPVIVQDNQLHLHLAEAEALLNEGHSTRAARILKAIVASDGPEHIRAEAVALLARLAERESYLKIAGQSEPFAFYKVKENETCLFSNDHNWSVCLTGIWQLQYRSVENRNRSYRIVYLKQDEFIITIASTREPYMKNSAGRTLALWDSLTGQTSAIQRTEVNLQCDCRAFTSLKGLEVVYVTADQSLYIQTNQSANVFQETLLSVKLRNIP